MATSSQDAPGPWQLQLEAHCQSVKLTKPVFHIVSDRRGGRTAWSSYVEVAGKRIAARYWFDGNNTKNAKEDAAEAALKWLRDPQSPTTFYQDPTPQAGVAYGRGMGR